jgi:hypothetical protein
MARKLRVTFWGTRGSIAAPGPATTVYGGNTSCVEVRAGEDILIFDSGTGIRELGLALMKEFHNRPLTVHLFISHTHWDHIQGFPFFMPAYEPVTTIQHPGMTLGYTVTTDGKTIVYATDNEQYRHTLEHVGQRAEAGRQFGQRLDRHLSPSFPGPISTSARRNTPTRSIGKRSAGAIPR